MNLAVAQSFVISILLAAGTALVLARRPPDNIASHLIRVLLAAQLFVFSDLGFNVNSDPSWARFWVSGIYGGVILFSVTWLELVIQYARVNVSSVPLPDRKWQMAIRALAVSISILMLTDPLHGQFVELRAGADNLYHWGFWIHIGFTYGLSTATVVILGLVWKGAPTFQSRRRVLILSTAPLMMVLGNTLQITAMGDLSFDPTVGAVGLAGIVFIGGIYWTQLFDLTPSVLREVVSRSRDCVLVADGDLLLRYANGAATRFFDHEEIEMGRDLSTLLMTKFAFDSQLLPERDFDEVNELVTPVYDEDESEQVWSLIGRAIRSRHGKIVCYSITLRDVTPQVTAERALRESYEELEERVKERTSALGREVELKEAFLEDLTQSEARYRGLLDASPLGVIACDQSGRLIASNQRIWQLLQESVPPAGFEFEMLDHPVLISSGLAEAMRTCIASGVQRIFESDFRLRNGSQVALRAHIAPFSDRDQKVRGAQAILEDVTELHRNRQEIEQSRNRLRALVREQSVALDQSRDELRESERLSSIGTLAAGVAHQINNPVGSILIGSEFALTCEQDPNVAEIWKQALTDTVEQATRCGQIVRSLLLFSRGENTPKWVEDANLIIHRACRTTEAYAADRDCRIVERLDDRPMPVLLSPIQIEQVFVNVLRNAVQSRTSGVGIDVHTERMESVMRIVISDDGPGIESAILEHILDPFYTTRVDEGGTGLGLSVAHGIVQAHAGRMSIRSEIGAGTKVVIELPLADLSG